MSDRVLYCKRDLIICGIWLCVLLYFAVLLKGAHFTWYDDFSHWALVIKSMLLENRMPTFKDPLISFQAYPLGSSLFVYYVCSGIGNSDACYMFGQLIMSVSFILPLASFVKKKNVVLGLLLIPIFAVFSLICNITIYDLLVDAVMPLAGVALFCIIECEVVEGKTDKINKTFFMMALLCIFLIQVKNSGIFFCLIAWIYFLAKIRNLRLKKVEKRNIIFRFWNFCIFLPLITFYLWKRHVNLVFISGETSKHAMSISGYKNVLNGKTKADIVNIFKQIVRRIIDIHDIYFFIMVIITIMIATLVVYNIVVDKKNLVSNLIKNLLFIYCIYALYIVSLFGMYIFSMPLNEAIELAAFRRYMLTVDIFILGMTVSLLLQKTQEDSNALVTIILTICLLGPVIKHKGRLPTIIKKQDDYQSSERYKIQKILQEYKVPSGLTYLIYYPNDESRYISFISRYELWSENVTIADTDNFADYLQEISDYQYIIIVKPDETSQKCLLDAGLELYATGTENVIKTEDVPQLEN